MSDEWSDDLEPAPKKKGGIPRWLWWTCGTGCALAVLLGIVAAIGGYFLVQQSTDPEVVHPKLMKYLPCDEWPEGYTGSGTEFFGQGVYTIQWPRGIMMLQPVGSRAQLAQILDPDSTSAHLTEKNIEMGELEVQGRTTVTQSFTQSFSDIPQVRVDISGDQGPCALLVVVGQKGDELDLALVEEFLAPFDVWADED